MKTKFSTVLIGGTYYALGYWTCHDDCLILEESRRVGSDFHAMLHPAEMNDTGETEKRSALGELMREYGVWTDKGFDLLKAAPAAHEYAARQIEKGKEILLDCRIIDIRREANGYTVRYFCNEGICEAAADEVIDTTVERISARDMVRQGRTTMNVFTVAQNPDFNGNLSAVCPECEILEGFNESEKLIRFPIAPDEDPVAVYRRITEIWKKAFPAGEEKILFVADAPDAEYESTGDGVVPWNGGRFPNPVSAFVMGGAAR